MSGMDGSGHMCSDKSSIFASDAARSLIYRNVDKTGYQAVRTVVAVIAGDQSAIDTGSDQEVAMWSHIWMRRS